MYIFQCEQVIKLRF